MKRRITIVAIAALLMLFMACNPETPVQYHKVNYIGADGNIKVTHDVENGKTDTPPESPTQQGYKFVGWSLSKDGKDLFDFNTPITGDITLYPIWGKTCTINYICDEDVVGTPDDVTVDIYTVVEAPEDPSNDGYDFKGWKTDLESEEFFSFGSITSDVTLYPVFEGKKMTVNFLYEDKKSLASKTYRTGDLLTPSSLGIGLDDSIFTWELVDSSTKEQYPVDKSLPYSESGYTFVVHLSSSLLTVDETGAISGSEALKAKEGPYTLFIPRYLNEKRVTSIKEKAFAECSSLESINIPGSVQSLGKYVFYDCSKLTNVILKEGLLTIEDRCFEGCSSLKTITIPSSVNIMDGLPFRWCQNLTEIVINKPVDKISGAPWGGTIFSPSKSITIKWQDHEATYYEE